MNKNTIILSLSCAFIGFVSAYFMFEQGNTNNNNETNTTNNIITGDESSTVNNPCSIKKNDRLDIIEQELSQVKQKVHDLEATLDNISASINTHSKPKAAVAKSRPSLSFNRRIYNLENLIRGGVDAGIAEDIVRRKNSVELKKLELNDRAKRDNYLGTQRFNDELENISRQDVDLREELGDQAYDEYLFNSKQNNRIRIISVMLGSAAEQAGIQKNDVVINYDNNRMFSWQELKNATSEGQLGDYVSIDIFREGQIYSFSVPRGPLGIQLGATRLEP